MQKKNFEYLTKLLLTVEILAVCVAMVFGFLWIQDPSGPFEPITFMSLLIGSTIVEIIRRKVSPESNQSSKKLSELNSSVLKLLEQINKHNVQEGTSSLGLGDSSKPSDNDTEYPDDTYERIMSLLSQRKKLIDRIEKLSKLRGISCDISNIEKACQNLTIPQTFSDALIEVFNYTNNILDKDEVDIQLSEWIDGLSFAVSNYLDHVISKFENSA